MNDNPNNKIKFAVIGILVFAAICGAVTAFLINFFAPKETYTSSNDDTINIESLYCTASDLPESFFVTSNADSVLHEIKITFKDEKADLISYVFTTIFGSDTAAKKHNDEIRYDLWSYLGDHNLGNDYLDNSFSAVDNSSRVNVIANKDNLDYNTAPIFYMETSDAMKFEQQTMSSMKKFYEAKGLKCKVNK